MIGLLTFLSGFEILYAALENSVLVAGLLAAINLGLALVGAYLASAPAWSRIRERPVDLDRPAGSFRIILLAFMRRSGMATGLAAGLCLLLALLAWQMPIDTTIHIGPLAFKISSDILIFGRRFVLDNADRAFLTLVYLGFLWFFGSPGRVACSGRWGWA